MEDTLYVRAIISLVFVLGLIGLLSLLMRKFGFGHTVSAKNGSSRLIIQEVRHIDPKRKLILIKRDNTEHLLLLSANKDTIIETNIASPDNHN